MITYKSPDRSREIAKIDTRLMRILSWVEQTYWWLWLEPLVITEVWRNDPSSTHYYYRAVDIAIPVKAGVKGAELIRELTNKAFPYGKVGFDTVPDIRHGTAPHIHIQVISK